MAAMIRSRHISSTELVRAHLDRIEHINPELNAVVELLSETALAQAREADAKIAAGHTPGPLHGVPLSVKDSIDVQDVRSSAGTLGRKSAEKARKDATLVARLREAGAIPIAKTNLPDLLFSFESDNLLFGRTNNPYELSRTSGGSSGGESALLAACGSPLGLGSDALGSVRVPAAFCGVASIKPTSGRLPRTGHVPPTGGWIEALWQIGPMARFVEDLQLVMELLAYPDKEDFTAPPVPLNRSVDKGTLRIAFFTYNGFSDCTSPVMDAVRRCAQFLADEGYPVEERRPAGIADAYELELALLGADGAEGIDRYLYEAGSTTVHPYTSAFIDHMRPYRGTASDLSRRWAQWDEYRRNMRTFFHRYDVVLCPVYTHAALPHGDSLIETNFRGFSYTMAWNLAGAPAATVRVGEAMGLPINVQIVAAPWADMTALALALVLEERFGGWAPPRAFIA